MAEMNCEACEALKALDANFVVNGITSSECNSLKNDKGLVSSSGNNDCTDLENMNDCLIGNMEATVDSADPCDWKSFVKDFIGNVYQMFKAFTCVVCGLWAYTKSYRLTGSGRTVTLTAKDGSHGSYTIPSDGITYSLSKSGNKIILTGSDGSTSQVTDTDTDTRYQLHTTTYERNIVVPMDDTYVVEVPISPPSGFSDTLYPMAVAGWTYEGDFASYLVTRYIQLIGRSSSSPRVKVAIRNLSPNHDATVKFMPEVLWWGRRTD